MPQLRSGDAPVKTGVEATQRFTQPPPRYSGQASSSGWRNWASAVSTYAATLQT